MADFMDQEAVEDSEEEMSAEESSSRRPKGKKKKKHSRQLSSDEEEEEEDEDEEKAREDMKGFIDDDDDGVEEEKESESGSDTGESSSRRRKKKRRKRRSEDEEDIDEEDMELLQENLGIKIQKKRKRIRMGSGSEEDSDGESRIASQRSSGDSEGEAHDKRSSSGKNKSIRASSVATSSKAGFIDSEEEAEKAMEEDEDDGFIVDEDGVPIQKRRKKKKTHIFEDSARQLAEDIFGVAFDYEEFEDDRVEEESDDEEEDDYDDEEAAEARRLKKLKKQKRKSAKTIFEIFEPRELELRHFTDLDNEVRNTDIPERMQLRSIPVTSVPEGSDELDREAEWIFKYGFIKPTISKQDGYSRDDCQEWVRKDRTVEKIKKALDFMRQQFHEVPFIAFYRKEYVEPELKINDLWRVYFMDENWCQLQSRKKNLRKLFKSMQNWQGEQLVADMDKPIPEGMRILSNEDLQNIDNIESYEELKDMDLFFKLYYSKDLEAMQIAIKQKRREAREAKRSNRKKKTKIITNEDGEEIQVTDEESPVLDSEDSGTDDQDLLRQASKNDPYSICRKYGLIGMSKRFGLTPEQFAENLRDGYQRHDLDQEPSEPLEVAAEYVNQKFKDPNDVLKAVKFVVATQLSREPEVRRVTREIFNERATICVAPTKKGLTEIDESHYCYSMKYLKNKLVRNLSGTQWLNLTAAEDQKLITITIATEIPSLSGNKQRNHLEEAKELYKHDGFSKHVTEWNNLRAECIETTFKEIIYPVLRQELRIRLTREAKDGVLRQCKNKMYDYLKTAKYTVSFEEEDEDDWDSSGGCRVMSISYENDTDVASYAVCIGVNGEVIDFLKMEALLMRSNISQDSKRNRPSGDRRNKDVDMAKLKSFIIQKRPHVIVVGAIDRDAVRVRYDVEAVVHELVEGEHQFPKIGVFLMDDNLAKVYSNSTRASQDFRDYPNVLRQGISLARRMQDPLIEFSQLAGPENEILCLNFHPLQNRLEEEELLEAINIEFINRTNEVGVDINECVSRPQTSNLVQFVGGLGPRKGAALLKTLRQMQSSQRLENRQQLVTLCHMGPKVLINCAGFIKIDTTSLGDSEVYLEVLDGSRIHNEAYEWARKMAVDALEYDEEEGNPATALEEIINDPEKLAELDLDAFARELERQGFGNKSITLYDIRAELYHMYKDLREPYRPPDPEEIFNIVTKENPETFYIGKLINATVSGFTYKKPQGEELDQAAPIRAGEENVWQCPFCGRDDFPELTEVWNHFDAGMCPGKATGVKIRIDNGVSGFIPIKNLSDKQVINPEDRVKIGQTIFCRIVKINPERFSVECISKTSALVDKEHEWKPAKDDFYDEEAQARDMEQSTMKKKQQERQTYIKRVIVHPSFYNVGYKEAERLIAGMDQSDVVIRPSSKGEDHLTVTWKVTDGIYEHIDVREEGKLNAFSLGQSLWIGNEEFEDLDEIIARHINPMAAHARDILNFKYYRDTEGGKREVADEMLKADKAASPGKIHYFLSVSKAYAGKFMLSYLPRTKTLHEFVTVTPDGFRFRKQVFETLSSLMKWFKEHFRDPLPGTPNTPGRLTSRTPYMTGGTPGPGTITPGAMSLATGTPYGTTPGAMSNYGVSVNTPYTPSGQTPFMTPYHTPGPSTTPRPSRGTPGPTPNRSFPTVPTPRSSSGGGGNVPSSGGRPSGGQSSHQQGRVRSSYSKSPAHGHRGGDSWQAALDAWPGGSSRRTPRQGDGSNTPRGFDGRQKTPKYGGNNTPKRTPKAFGDATPLYDE
ncbi:transcription elongation factor SPT6 [Lepeophtheirus salmonis]|uniref:transcription elongation factor SPT6 n=1 Tax=Lepeophtheirus salmonis TaxID=72036 RepID=UPI001AEA909D|nr:transcription elongation factor SPT6-like [Lepeophtheirus salmonis]